MHPAWMIASVSLALVTLRLGLRIRRLRLAGERVPRALRERHLQIAKPAVVMLLVGFVGGPVSAVYLRGWEPVRTFHGVLGIAALLLFAAAAVQGRRLERGARDAREAHGWLGLIAMLIAGVASVAGMVLLP